MPEDLGEKTEEPTQKRLDDARDEGNVAKSQDLAAGLLLLGVTVALYLGTMPMLGQLKVYLDGSLQPQSAAELLRVGSLRDVTTTALWVSVKIGAPLLLAAWALAYLSHFVQVGWLISSKALKPKLSKLNPITGAQRIFGISGVVKAMMDSAKVLLVVAIVILSIASVFDVIVVLPGLDIMQGAGRTGWLLFELAIKIAAVLLILGLLDYMFQKWKHRRDLRMSRTEIKEELKQTDGDPETKKRRMRIQQQLAMQRLGAAVPKADVVVTNPEHISIAIQYDAERMNAPRVVAMGQDYVALRIRQLALQHGIPIVERKPLARALFRSVKTGQEIPHQFYQAIAEVLAYVYRLSGRMVG